MGNSMAFDADTAFKQEKAALGSVSHPRPDVVCHILCFAGLQKMFDDLSIFFGFQCVLRVAYTAGPRVGARQCGREGRRSAQDPPAARQDVARKF